MTGAPAFTSIILDASSPVAHLTLHRPRRRNALDLQMMTELVTATEILNRHPGVRTVVLSGSGPAFCAGFDLAEFEEGDADAEHAVAAARLGTSMVEAFEGLVPVTIGALHGSVVGGGVVLAAACDLRMAAADTAFSIPEVDLGIPLIWGGIPRLLRSVGPALTKDLVLTGRTLTGVDAERAGFVTRVTTPSDLSTAAEAVAAGIASRPRLPIQFTKSHVDALQAGGTGLDETEALLRSLGDEEASRHRRAYLERRSRPGTDTRAAR